MDDLSTRTKQFLLDLRKLTIKHGLSIGGCGCCESPYLLDRSDQTITTEGCYSTTGCDNITWLEPDSPKWDSHFQKHLLVRPTP